ncbi:MAG: hypothetical protein ACODAJ_14065, partial [Planctomycetota bacterium]
MRRRILSLLIALATGAAMSDAAEPAKPGDEMLRAYIRQEAARLDARYLDGIERAADWEARRDEYRRQFLWMLALWPLP